jgi:hypothetical protein
MVGAGGIVLVIGQRVPLRTRLWNPALRVALWSFVCGLAGYLFYSLALPGSSFLEEMQVGFRGLLIGFVCGLVPLVAIVWLAVGGSRSR